MDCPVDALLDYAEAIIFDTNEGNGAFSPRPVPVHHDPSSASDNSHSSPPPPLKSQTRPSRVEEDHHISQIRNDRGTQVPKRKAIVLDPSTIQPKSKKQKGSGSTSPELLVDHYRFRAPFRVHIDNALPPPRDTMILRKDHGQIKRLAGVYSKEPRDILSRTLWGML